MDFIKEKKLLLILSLAFLVRLIGIDYGLPSLYNSDEPFNVLNALAYGAKKNLEPTYFVYPALYSYLLAAVYACYFGVGRLFGLFENAIDFGASYFIDPSGIFFWGRLLSVLFGTATVWLVYLIGRRFFSQRVAVLAALLLALSSIHVDLSHWVLPEATLSFFCAAAIFYIFQYTDDSSQKNLLCAGLTCGLAISTKYNAGFLLVPLLVTIFYGSHKDIPAFLKSVLSGLASTVAGFLIGSPYWLVAPGKYWDALKYTFSHIDSGMIGHINSMPLVWPLWELISLDLTIGFLFVAGVIYFVLGAKPRQVLLLSFILPTLLYVGIWNRTGIHYIVPIFPALTLLSGCLIDRLAIRNFSRPIVTALLAIVILPPLVKISVQDFRLTRMDSRDEAKRWIEANIPSNTMIAYENYVYGPNLFDPGRFLKASAESQMLPIAIKEKLLEESFRRPSFRLINLRKDFKLKTPVLDEAKKNAYLRQLLETRLPRLSEIQQASVPYILTSSDNYGRYFTGAKPKKKTPLWLSYQNGRSFYQSVFESPDLTLLQEFKPREWGLGPTIRLYEVNNAAISN